MKPPALFDNPVHAIKALELKEAPYWENRGSRMISNLFKKMSKKVPAYQHFLKQNKIRAANIRSAEDIKSKIPALDKANYLRKYSTNQLCWHGKFSNSSWVISSTSGSTGEPFYFPRQEEQDIVYARLAEMYLRSNFDIHKKTTLYINTFPLGVWIGGIFTYQAIRMVALRGKYNLSIINPGVHKAEILKAVRKLSHHFDQTIIGSYGPFLKDILDDGEAEGLKWHKYNVKFVFSAEGFTEKFRDYVLEKVSASNPYTSSLNHYGTVDLGTMSYETPVSVLIRRLALSNKKLYHDLFGDTVKLPTLTQYIPELFYFEEVEGDLYCSSPSGLPLVRYDLKDHGGVISFRDMGDILQNHGFDLEREAIKASIKKTLWKLPFVYIYERSDFSVSYYAFQIYPETNRRALLNKSLAKKVTGKFTMTVNFTRKHNQRLDIYIELRPRVSPTPNLRNKVVECLHKQLLEESSEYYETFKEKGHSIKPHVIMLPYEDTTYFRAGAKQQWVK